MLFVSDDKKTNKKLAFVIHCFFSMFDLSRKQNGLFSHFSFWFKKLTLEKEGLF